MKKVIFLIVMIICLSAVINAYEWEIEVVDPDLFNQYRHYLSLALDNSDHSHIAYYIGRLNGQPPSTIRYALWNGTDWEISMIDQSNLSSVAVETTSIALDDNGYPHISYTGYDGDSYCLKYALWTGTYWDLQIIDNSSGRVGEFNSLKLDSLGYPHISYYDNDGDYLKYASWNGQTWEMEIVSNGLAWGTSLELDSNDNPCIAYYGDGHVLNYLHWNGTSWDFYNVDDFGGNVGSIDISLKLDSQNFPHITYYMFDQTLSYARWDGLEWIITTVTGNYGGAYSWLALDSQDYPHIVYYQAVGYNWNVWYKYWDGSSWHNEVVNQPLGGGWNCRIALDSQEHPRIAYFNQNTDDLEYAEPIIPIGIEGTVYLEGGTGNVEEVIVTAGSVSVNPNANGLYSIGIGPGTYDVIATLEYYDPDTVAGVVVEEGVTTSGVDLILVFNPPLNPPQNLAVTELGYATWDAPASRELLGYNVYLDGNLIEFTTDLFYQYTDLINSQNYIAGVSAVYDDGESGIIDFYYVYTGTNSENNIILVTELFGNYPNPFNPSTTISFQFSNEQNQQNEQTKLEIYNLKGQKIKTFSNLQINKSPNQQIIWNGKDDNNQPVSSGIYFYQLKAGNDFSETKRMLLLK